VTKGTWYIVAFTALSIAAAVLLPAYSVVILLLLAWSYPSRYTRGRDVYWVFALYVGAKAFETFDEPLLAMGHLASGHTLKPLAAALAGFVVCRMLMLRRLEEPDMPGGDGGARRRRVVPRGAHGQGLSSRT